MRFLSDGLIGFVVLEHLGFMVLEMFFWERPFGQKMFRMTRETAEASAFLAKNQGLYNGFLAAGLIWSLMVRDPSQSFSLQCFFLGCIIVAGIYGSFTAFRSIFYLQAMPALAALLSLFFYFS